MLVRPIRFAALVLSLVACGQLVGEPPAAAGNHGRHDIGEVVIFNQGLNNLVVAVDTGGKDGFVDQWFVLQTLEPAPATHVHLRIADILFRDGLLRVSSQSDRTAYEFAVNGATPGPELKSGYTLARTEGYGLSHNRGETTLRLPSKDKGTCDDCESLDQDWGDIGGGTGGASCDAGGVGARSCSMTSGTKSCSVSCDSSSYACCRTTSTGVRCSCVY